MDKSQAIEPLLSAGAVLEPSKFSLQLIRLDKVKEADPALFTGAIIENSHFSSRLLGYINDLFPTAKVPLVTIVDTVAELGRATVANLALFSSLLEQNRHGKCAQFDYQRFWQRSLAMANAARALATRQNLDADQLFCYGALARIGELALATLHPKDYGTLLAERLTFKKREQQEKKLFGWSASELSWKLLAGWQLPRQCTEAIRAHGLLLDEEKKCGKIFATCKILKLAAYLTKICLMDLPLGETFIKAEKEAENQSISGEQFADFFDQLVISWQTSCEFFNIPAVHCPNYHQIKTVDDAALEINQHKPPPLTFLVADDDPLTLIYLKKMLANSQRVLLTAENGAQALEIALEHRPHLLITNWWMPKMNGIELCKILRKTRPTQHMYIIMLTCNETEDELVQAFDAGVDDFMIKPLTPKALQARISSAERLLAYQQTVQRDRETIQRYATRLATANRKLQNMAMTDFLTGLPNRRTALLRLKNLVAEVKRYQEPLSCLMIDIDHFKKINDNYGHDRGDTVLQEISKLLEEKARSYDTVSRWGGEEFLIICARSGPTDACQLAERLRRTVERYRIVLNDKASIKTTVSIGVASWSPSLQNEDELIKEADTNLYLAKTNGRNRIEAPGDQITPSLPQ